MNLANLGLISVIPLILLLIERNCIYLKFLVENNYPLFDFKSTGRVFTNERNPWETLTPSIPLLDGVSEVGSRVPKDENWLESSLEFMTNMYYSQWSVYERNHYPRDIPFENISNIFYCFMGINTKTGEVQYLDENSDLEIESFFQVQGTRLVNNSNDRAKIIKTKGAIDQFMKIRQFYPDLKISMSIGGWGLGENFANIVKSHSKFQFFIKTAIAMMKKHDFNGIDIDWEFPNDEHEAWMLVKILRYLRYEFNKIERLENLTPGSLILSIASPCSGSQMEILQLKEMDRYLNFWNLMCYDFAGSWSRKVEYHSNLYATHEDQFSGDKAVQYYLTKKIHPRKLVLGMPNYGRGFTNTKGYRQPFEGVGHGSSDEPGIWNYNYLPLNNSEEHFDDQAVAAYCYDQETKTWISYDNQDSSIIKARYVKTNKLGGGMWWESCGEVYGNSNRSTVSNFVSEINKL